MLVFNRSEDLPGGGHLDQSDGTAWMAFYTLEMLAISLELTNHDDSYEDQREGDNGRDAHGLLPEVALSSASSSGRFRRVVSSPSI